MEATNLVQATTRATSRSHDLGTLYAANIRTADNAVSRSLNRSLILHLLRIRQPVSRADLARLSGLQRCTVSSIVEQLIEESWVVEGPAGRLPIGRHPQFLRLNSGRVVIAVDWNLPETTVALFDCSGQPCGRESMETHSDPEVAVERLIAQVQGIVSAHRGYGIEGIGMCMPDGRRRDGPVADIGARLAQATGLEVELDHAANVYAMATQWFEQVEDSPDTAIVSVSDTLGTGMVANGKVLRGLNGMAGQFAHFPLDPDGPPCVCGARGCWEVYASNRAAVRNYGTPGITFPDLLVLAGKGDIDAEKVLDTMARHVGRFLQMIVASVAPEQVFVIGELTRDWRRFGPVIAAELATRSRMAVPRITPLAPDRMARLRGAVALVLEKHFGANREVSLLTE